MRKKSMTHRFHLLTVALLLCLATRSPAEAAGPTADQYDSAVPRRWYFLLYDRVKAESFSPPVAARAFGAAGVALYQAVHGGMPANVSLVRQLNDLKALPAARPDLEYHWPSAANAALAEILRSLFAAKRASLSAFAELENEIHDALASGVVPDTLARSTSLGESIGQAIGRW
ncbi:MAG: hypothetical protein ACREQQ_04580, partial [Candidatus Binatia bacterium]